MMVQFVYIYEGDELRDVLAVDGDGQHTLVNSDGQVLMVFTGNVGDALVEEAFTPAHCIPAGAGWHRAGTARDGNGRLTWRWKRQWLPVAMPGSIGTGEDDSDDGC
jgi:hypothetical protein